jgi:hypothetical protein
MTNKPDEVEVDEETVEEKTFTVFRKGMLKCRIADSRLESDASIRKKLDKMKSDHKPVKEMELAGDEVVIKATSFNKDRALAGNYEKAPVSTKEIIAAFRIALFKAISFEPEDKNQTTLVKKGK